MGIAMLNAQLLAQASRQVTGRVTDEDGHPVANASVMVKGTQIGTSTNENGDFSFNVPATAKTLVITGVGFLEYSLPIGSGRNVVVMKKDERQMEEIVVTAYGQQKKKAITGATVSLSGNKINQQPVQSFDQALAGKVAGVQVSSASGLLADGISVRIRGTNSISISSQPLVVIDGIPITESTNLNVFNGGNGTRFNPMATINPNDIESIDILQDAASAAMYGSRAGNGVILITTKKGKSGKSNVSYNNYFGIATAARLPKLLNAQDFITIQNEKASNWYGSGVKFADTMSVDGRMVETNWLDEAFRNGFVQNHQLSISGATDKTSIYASADYTAQQGIVIGNELKRGSVRLNADVRPVKWLKVGMSANYSKTLNSGVLSDGYLAGVTLGAYNAPPNVPVKNADGSYYLASGLLASGKNLYSYNGTATYLNAIYHPVATINLQRNQNTSDRILANAFADLTPIKGLTITSKLGIDYMNNFEDQYSSPKIAGLGRTYNGLVQDNTVWIKQWNWQNYANYSLTAGDHHIGVTAGLEYQKRDYKDLYTMGGSFVADKYTEILDGLYSEYNSGGTKNSRGFYSYFGRATYSFNDKYYLEAAFRADGYTGFGENYQVGYFPGVSAGWRISREEFFKNILFVDDLKLRGSWGKVGNSNVGPYASQTLYAGGLYGDINGLSINQVGNKDLKWESIQKSNIGFDAAILKNRINFSFDYWVTSVSDLLLNAPVLMTTGIPTSNSPTVGNTTIFTNVGKMNNKGIELQLNTVNVRTQDLQWTSTLNFTTVKNKIKELSASGDILATTSLCVGQPMGVFRLYEWAKVDPQTGRAGYIDGAGNIKYYNPDPGVAQANRWTNEKGEVVAPLGSTDLKIQDGKTGAPKWYGNFDNTVTYKGFDLTLGLQFAGGNYILNTTRSGLMTPYFNNNLEEIKNRWTTPGQITDVPKLVWGQSNYMIGASTRFLEKANFLRFRELSLGYNFSTHLIGKVGLSLLRVYVRANNLALITKYKGADPEISTARNANYSGLGIDSRSVPMPRSFTFGLNVTL